MAGLEGIVRMMTRKCTDVGMKSGGANRPA